MDFFKKSLNELNAQDMISILRHGEIGSKLEEIFADFFGSFDTYSTIYTTPSIYEGNILQYVFKDFLKHKKYIILEDKSCSIGIINLSPPIMKQLYYEKSKCIEIYENGYIFAENEENKDDKIIIYFQDQANVKCWSFSVSSNNTSPSLFLTEWKEYAKNKNPYKGKKITPSCKFLNIEKNNTWDNVIIPEDTKNAIKYNINELFEIRDILKKNNIKLKRGVILSGPPGTGKTMLCKTIVNDIDFSVLYVLPSDIQNSLDLGYITEIAQDISPCLLILEDIDWIAEERNHGEKSSVIELMNKLDGLEDFSDVITLGTTNNYEIIENAIKNRPGRFDRVINIVNPNKECREKIINVYMKDFEVNDNLPMKEIVDYTEGLSAAHIKDICITSALFAIRDNSLTKKEKIKIKNKHIIDAISEIKNKDFATFYKNKSTMGFSDQQNDGRNNLIINTKKYG